MNVQLHVRMAVLVFVLLKQLAQLLHVLCVVLVDDIGLAADLPVEASPR